MAGSPWGLEGKSGRWLREGRVQPSEKQMEGAWLWREAATGFLCAHQILGSTPGVTRGSGSPSGGRSSLEMSGLSSTGGGGRHLTGMGTPGVVPQLGHVRLHIA